MLQLVNEAIEKMKTEKQDFEVFTICIYTDFNSCYSAVCLDRKEHSDKSHLQKVGSGKKNNIRDI